MIPQIAVLLFVLAYTAIGCFWDLKTRKLPNWLTVTSFALGLLFHTVVGAMIGQGALSGFLFALAGFGMGFGLLFVLMAIGGGGGGDVKFMGALGTWVGWKLILVIFIGSGLIAAVSMVVLMGWNLLATKQSKSESGDNQSAGRRLIPYAIPATISAWLVLGSLFWVAVGR